MKKRLGIVIPTFNAFDYAMEAVLSAANSQTNCEHKIVVVDDASVAEDFAAFETMIKSIATKTYRYETNGGLTRSWNTGLRLCRDLDCDYICVTNADVVFPSGWTDGLVSLLDESFSLVGPLTNAPGTEDIQQVANYWADYVVSNDITAINETQQTCSKLFGGMRREHQINGFCMVAKTSTWTDYAYDVLNAFRPKNTLNSKGKKNPTPLMTLNEYELQQRWRDRGLKIGVALDSFVFHYRSVCRGIRYSMGQAFRKTVNA